MGASKGDHAQHIHSTHQSTFAAPLWSPNISSSNVQKIQRVKNSALRICLCAHNKASSSHLHSESKTLLVDDHLQLLCTQHLASALRPDHPSHSIVTCPLGQRPKRSTLQSHFLTEGILPPTSYKFTIANLHTQFAQNANLQSRS